MKGYILRVVGMSLVLGLSEQLVPTAKSRGYVRLVGALCLLAILVAPLGRALDELPALFERGMTAIEETDESMTEYERILAGSMTETVRSELEGALRQTLAERFGVNPETVRFGISFASGEPIRVKKVLVTLSGRDVFRDPYAIEKAVSTCLGCECVVVTE